ncbi:MAG TPA: GNAT family N-acetyltransferase [Candidatus Binatia bacterium]|nr:GNAT family N-acetyltransferase [Candidatus Binatia bacterium]
MAEAVAASRVEVRLASTGADLAEIARIANAVQPDEPLTVDQMRWADERYPGGSRFLATIDGEPAGMAGGGRVYIYPPDHPAWWGNIAVLPAHRGHGVGSALLAAVSAAAARAGKRELMGRTTEDRPEAIEFLAHRGIREVERSKVVRLELAGHPPVAVEAPEGVRITSLEAQPDLVAGVYAVAKDALPDIPGEGPVAPETLEEFVTGTVDRPQVPAGGFAVALDDATGEVIGYANLQLPSAGSTIAWHAMTAVARAWRGRGVAAALKRATIAWAQANALEALESSNDVENAPMRAVNRRLGYQPRPDEITVRGPLWFPDRPTAAGTAHGSAR